ncbi:MULTISPECIES: hypothetical protein [unclassified Janthinobacterium]|uniref:hypothetical protein n=1 Tax=unclassified Janthinobacterium TaxID=2610881 RepID=UPI001612D2FC|nr:MULTISPECIES: hypothetical protein [unclassified Janthinobacterium]MBB5370001.1 hypothetical protein [Janthinobacterium sp. K2C7]MBB5382807.1 hypothetical protein [Janthinobacterium sp. K2Li3]MBB5384792.1 hypothetical protein [Janthinobacterium sp. K2E3]
MNRQATILALASTLVMETGIGLRQASAAGPVAQDICSARFRGTPQQQVEAMRLPLQIAINTLDNARIDLPSPSLASGNINYISISPSLAEQTDKICVVGYFELWRNNRISTLPLLVDHIANINGPKQDEAARPAAITHIYFRAPKIEEFDNAGDLKGSWNFWDRHQQLRLRIAAFDYENGERGHVHFGRDMKLSVSSKFSSIVAATLFAAGCYLLAAAAIPALSSKGARATGWRKRLRYLLPWYITGSGGHASLSQLQMLLFTLIVATLLFYQWLRTGLLQELSTDLLYLIGISTAGTAGSQITTSIKKELKPQLYAYAQQLGWFTAPLTDAHTQASAAELLQTDKRFDIYKFQMLVFTVVIAAYVIASGADALGNIQISATLLTLMGMSQGAYVGGHAASDQLSPLEDQLTGMRDLQQRYQASTDMRVSEELRRRFQLAAAQAAVMFSRIFPRTLPDYMLEMPLDAAPTPPAQA